MAFEANAAATDAVNQLALMGCPIAKIADKDLAAIFKCLPPFERLIVSEVSRKWRDLSKTLWRDISHLDLSKVPTANIHAVIRKCPNLNSVSALRQNLGDLGRFASRLHNATSLKCAECTFTIQDTIESFREACDSLRAAPLSELIWHKSSIRQLKENGPPGEMYMPLALPTSTLKRFQLSAWNLDIDADDLFRLPQLVSFIVSFASVPFNNINLTLFNGCLNEYLRKLSRSKNLREVYLDSAQRATPGHMSLVFSLPKLEILFLNNFDLTPEPLVRLLTKHPSLRVVVLTSAMVPQIDGEIVVPARKLFPNGFHAEPVPPLHLFLGKVAAEKLRLHPSPMDALKIYPINAPLSEFLEKEELKKIFEGSWIASRIKEGAKERVNLPGYEGDAGSIQYVQE